MQLRTNSAPLCVPSMQVARVLFDPVGRWFGLSLNPLVPRERLPGPAVCEEDVSIPVEAKALLVVSYSFTSLCCNARVGCNRNQGDCSSLRLAELRSQGYTSLTCWTRCWRTPWLELGMKKCYPIGRGSDPPTGNFMERLRVCRMGKAV